MAKVKSTPAKWDVEKLHRHPSCVPDQRDITRPERAIPNGAEPRQRRPLPSALSAPLDEDEFGGDAFEELDFVHPDEVCLLESHSPVKQPPNMDDGAPRRYRSRSPVQGQAKSSHPHGQQQSRGKSAPPIPMESVPPPASHMLPLPGQLAEDTSSRPTAGNSANEARRHVQSIPQNHGDDTRQANGGVQRNGHAPQMRDYAGAESIQNGNGERLPTPPPTGFVNSRAAEILNTENRGSQSPEVPAFNPHVSGNIPRTKGIDHSKSAPISRQIVTKAANGIANGGSGAPPPRMNFVNPQADSNRKIGMPMSVVPSPLANRSAYKPPRPAGVKRGPEGPPRPPLADVSNIQPNGAGDADSKRPRFDDGATENNAPVPAEKANG